MNLKMESFFCIANQTISFLISRFFSINIPWFMAAVVMISVLSCTKESSKISLPAPSTQTTVALADTPPNEAAPTEASSLVPSSRSTKLDEGSASENNSSRVSGTITAAKQGQTSFRIAGQILQTNVNVGDKVKKGQLLAFLVDKDLALRKKMALLQIDQAKINLEQANRDHFREMQLFKEGASTPVNSEKVTNQLNGAQLNLSLAQVNLEQIESQLEDAKLIAPFSGVISKRHKVEGEWVAAGAAVYDLSAQGEIEVNLRVPAALLKRLQLRQKVVIHIPTSGKKTEMEVTRIVPVIQENSRTFEVVGKILVSESELIPGQFVEAQF
jgi:RND family efflux transporter MFP subunit